MTSRPTVKGALAGLTEEILGGGEGGPVAKPRARGTGAIGAPTELAQFSVGYQELERKVDTLEKQSGRGLRVRIDLCDDGDKHATPLNRARVERVKANLQHHRQTSPGVVRAKPDGRFEVIAGRHRKAALAELGQEEWDVILQDFDDESAVRSSFYDNLIGPELTDFEIYSGFRRLRNELGMSLEKLAEESGRSLATVHSYFVFEKFPKESLAVIVANQERMTYTLLKALAPYVDENPDGVLKALQFAAENAGATVAGLLALVKPKPKQAPAPARKPQVFKVGKKQYAEMTATATRLVVDIKTTDPNEIKEVERLVADILRARAEALKSAAESGKP